MALNTALFGALFMFLTPGFETNDDLTMKLIASGFYTGHPSEYLVFTNVLIGFTLKAFYGLVGGADWYLYYLVGAHFVALTGLSFLVLKRSAGWRIVILYFIFFFLIEARLFLNLQFTTTSFLVGTTGVFLLADGFVGNQPLPPLQLAASFGFVALAILIRDSAVLLLGLIAFPFLLVSLGPQRWKTLLAIFAIGAALFLGLTGFNRWYYQRDRGWAEYVEYNHLRGQLHLTPLQRFIPQAASSAGWSANDAAMFVGCYYSEPEVYAGADRMRRLHHAVASLAVPEGVLSKFGIRDLILWDLFGSDAGLLLGLAGMGCVCCVWFAREERGKFLVILSMSYLTFVAVCCYLRETARLPPRVAYNLPLFLACLSLYWAASFSAARRLVPTPGGVHRVPDFRRLRLCARLVVATSSLAICVLLAGKIGLNLHQSNQANRRLKEQSMELFAFAARLPSSSAKPVIVVLPYDSLFERSLVYLNGNQAAFAVVPYGWLSHSPLFQEVLAEHRLLPYSTSLLDRQNIVFLMEERWIGPLKTFYREHYRIALALEEIRPPVSPPSLQNCTSKFYRAQAIGLPVAFAKAAKHGSIVGQSCPEPWH